MTVRPKPYSDREKRAGQLLTIRLRRDTLSQFTRHVMEELEDSPEEYEGYTQRRNDPPAHRYLTVAATDIETGMLLAWPERTAKGLRSLKAYIKSLK